MAFSPMTDNSETLTLRSDRNRLHPLRRRLSGDVARDVDRPDHAGERLAIRQSAIVMELLRPRQAVQGE